MPALQPAAAAPMLLQAAPAEPPAVAPRPAGMDAGTGAAPAPAPAAPAAAEAEVASLMGFMLPQLLPPQPTQAQESPAAAFGAAATCAQAGQRASADEQPVASSRRLAAPAAPARPATAPGITTGLPHAAAAACGARLFQGQQRSPADQQGSRAKVLSWLSHSDDGPCDAIPAVHAAAPQPAAAQRVCAPEESWRLPLPQRAAAPLRRSPVQRLAPADYCAQLQRAGTPRKLQLTRLTCQGCGQAGQACSCSAAAGAAPLRLLRPRQPAYTSPGRHRGSGGGQQAKQPEPCSMVSAGSHAFCPASTGQPAGFSIATIQKAYFGDASMLQRGIGAAALGQPGAAPQLACLPLPPPAASTGGNGGGVPQLDVWAAYLAARRQAASEAAAGAGPATGQSSGGPLSELRGIAQRIRSMQGHISGFLLRQRGGPAPAAGAPADAPLHGGSSWAPLPAAAAQPAQLAPASTGQERDTGSLFTDDFILSMQVGTDWRQLEHAALEVAAGRSGAAAAGAAGAGNLSACSGSAAAGGSGALQRLKQAQRVVTAERVGRQVQRAA